MAYKRVYSPDGVPFDVPDFRANDLILQNGWTQQPVTEEKKPESEPKPTPKKRARRKKKDPVIEPVAELVEEEQRPAFSFNFDEEPVADTD